MKKLISLLVVVAVMAACLATTVFAAEAAEITVGTVEAAPGEEVTIDVTIANNPGFAATKIYVECDEALTLTKIDVAGKLLGNGSAAINLEKGLVSFASAVNVNGDGVLMTLTFVVAEDAEGCSFEVAVNVNNMNAADTSDVEFTTVAGAVTNGEGHVFGEWYTVKEATCTEKGEERRDCQYCDCFETRETDVLDHIADGEGWYKDASGHWHVCECCADAIDFAEHTYGEGVKGEDGWTVYVCTVCGYEKSEETPPTGDMSAVVFALCAVSATGLVTLTAKKKED